MPPDSVQSSFFLNVGQSQRQRASMTLLQVVIPDGVEPGQQFTVEAGGCEWTVTSPCQPGTLVNLDLPLEAGVDDGQAVEQPTGVVEVAVPEGVGPGDSFLVEAMHGLQFSVVVPEGCAPGSPMRVALPVGGSDQLMSDAESGALRLARASS
eukprot:1716562-Prymnesium_polylepis.1